VGVKVNGFLEILFLEFCKSKAKTLVFVEITRVFNGCGSCHFVKPKIINVPSAPRILLSNQERHGLKVTMPSVVFVLKYSFCFGPF